MAFASLLVSPTCKFTKPATVTRERIHLNWYAVAVLLIVLSSVPALAQYQLDAVDVSNINSAGLGQTHVAVFRTDTQTQVADITGFPVVQSFTPKKIRSTSTPSGRFLYYPSNATDEIFVIDADNNVLKNRLALPGKPAVPAMGCTVCPFALAFTPDGSTGYIGTSSSTDILVFKPSPEDPSVGDFSTIKTGVQGQTIDIAPVVKPDGTTRIYVLQTGANFANQASIIDPATNKIVSQVSFPSGPFNIMAPSPDGSRIYVASPPTQLGVAGSLFVIDTSTNTTVGSPVTIGDSSSDVGVSRDGSSVWVTNLNDNSVAMIDTKTMQIVKTVSLGDPKVLVQEVHQVEFTPDGKTAFVASTTAAYQFDLSTQNFVTMPLDGNLTIAVLPAASLDAKATASTVKPGQSATYELTFKTKGVGAAPAVTLACNSATLPTGTTCSFSPATVTPTAAGTKSTLTITTTGTAARLSAPPASRSTPMYASWIGLVAFVSLGVGGAGATSRRKIAAYVGIGLAVCLLLLAFGCGGGSSSPTSPTTPPPASTPPPPQQPATTPGNYVVTVTGTTTCNGAASGCPGNWEYAVLAALNVQTP